MMDHKTEKCKLDARKEAVLNAPVRRDILKDLGVVGVLRAGSSDGIDRVGLGEARDALGVQETDGRVEAGAVILRQLSVHRVERDVDGTTISLKLCTQKGKRRES